MSAQQRATVPKYDGPTRKYIRSLIAKEFQENGPKFKKRKEFTEHIRKVLTEKGIKSPDGKTPITYAKASAQITHAIGNLIPKRGEIHAPAADAVESYELKMRSDKVPPALRAILLDTTLTAEQRLRMVCAFFGV